MRMLFIEAENTEMSKTVVVFQRWVHLGIFVVVVRKKKVCWEAALLQRQKIPVQSLDPLQRSFFSQPTPQAESDKQFDMGMFNQVNYCSSSLMCHPLWYYLCHRYSTSTILAREDNQKEKVKIEECGS